jgi:hypothetical protein
MIQLNSRQGTGSGVHPASYITGIEGFSPGLKRLGREAITPLPIRRHGLVLTQAEKEPEPFYLYLLPARRSQEISPLKIHHIHQRKVCFYAPVCTAIYV